MGLKTVKIEVDEFRLKIMLQAYYNEEDEYRGTDLELLCENILIRNPQLKALFNVEVVGK